MASANQTPNNPVHFFSMLFHLGKTSALASSVLKDERVHWFSKLAFVTGLGALVLAVIFPELAGDVAALAIPGVGEIFDLLGLPVEGIFDWVAFTVAAFNLLKLFPAEVVGEHYDRLFRSKRWAA